MLKVELNQEVMLRTEQSDMPRLRKPAWYKATDEDKNSYTTLLDDKLKNLDIPATLDCTDVTCQCSEHSQQRDSHLIDILCTLVETSYACIPLTAKPRSDKGSGQRLPGWNTTVAPLKDDSLFWHSVWKDAGSPQSGALHQVMCHARRKYHTAVKQAKRLAGNAKAEELLSAAEAGDAALMLELKKSIDKKCNAQTIPDSLDGEVTQDSILERFRECYKGLFNSAGSEDAMVEIKSKLEEMINENSVKEVKKVTAQVVKTACCKMKAGKNDVTDVYTSDALLHAPDYLFELLAAVFDVIPDPWNCNTPDPQLCIPAPL